MKPMFRNLKFKINQKIKANVAMQIVSFSSIKLVSFRLLATSILLLFVTIAHATTYYSLISGTTTDPKSTASWWTNTNGTGAHPANFTTIGDVFVIQSGSTMKPVGNWSLTGSLVVNGTFLSSTKNIKLGSLTVNSGGAASTGTGQFTVNGATIISGTLSVSTTNTTLIFKGLVQINSGGVWNETVAAKPFFYGGITNNGTFTASTGLHTFSTNNQSVGGNNAISIPSVTVTTITLTNNGTLTVGTALAGTGGLTQGTNAILNIGGTSAITTLTASAANGNTVKYTALGNQTVKPTSYNNLTLAGSGTKTTTSVTVNGVLSMEGTATASAAPTYGTAATLQYNTTTARTAGVEWISPFTSTGGIIITNTGAISLNAAKVLSCGVPLTINSGSTLATNNFALTFGGNFVNNGTFTAGSSSIIIGTCTGDQSISGFTTTGAVSMTKTGGTATFTNNVNAAALTINGSGGTLNMGSGLTHTFSGTVTLTAGTLDGGSSTINANGATAWAGTGTLFTASNSTVVFGLTGAQTITASSTTFNNVTFSGSGNKTLSNVMTVNAIMSVSGSAVVLLPNGTNSTVYVLKLGGVGQVGGSWGGTGSTATNKSSTWFGNTTTGILTASTLNRFIVTGSATQTAGTTQNLTITLVSPSGATFTSYTGDHAITFSGANSSTNPVTPPTIKDKNGNPISFGTATTLTFSNGVASVSAGNNGVMALYKAENALISVTDGTYSSKGSDNLAVVVSAAAYSPKFTTQPGGGLVNTIWSVQPVVTVQDAFGNLSTGIAYNITLAIQNNAGPGGILNGTTTVAVNQSTAQALFSNLSIDVSGAAYTLSATSSPSTSTGISGAFDISNPAPTLTGITPSTVCSGGNDFMIEVTGTNFNPKSVVLFNGSPRSTTFTDSNLISAIITTADIASAGTPSITVSNPTPGGGTTSAATLTVSRVVVTSTIGQPTCFSSGTINTAVSGGTAPYSYVWSDLASTINVQNRLGLSAGTYSLTVTDAIGCSTSTGNLVLTAPSCSGITVCQSDESSVISTDPDPANTSYSWTVPSGAIIVSGQGTSSITVNWNGVSPGSYSVCVVGNNTCGTSTQSCQTVAVRKPVSSAYADPVCSGGSLNLYAFGGTAYAWTGPNGFTSNQQYPVIYNATSLNSGTYTVIVSDSYGCTSTSTVSVTVNTPTTITGLVTNSTCGNLDGAVNISVSGGTGFTFLWDTGETTQNISGIGSGNYTVTASNSSGCSSSKTFMVNDATGPTVSLASSVNVSCYDGNNGAINITVSGGTSPYTFAWSTGEITQNISGLPAGSYDVSVTDANGCSSGLTVTITQPVAPIQANGSVTNVNCFGGSTGSITLTVSGGTSPYTYNWGGGVTTQNRTALSAGTYTVTIIDNKSCTLVQSFVVTQPASALSASTVATSVSCYGGSNGIVDLTVTGGTSPYTYVWSKSGSAFSASSSDLTSLSAGTYNVIVTDANGCTTTASAIVTQPAAALTLTASVTNASCYGSGTGSIVLTPSGGTPSYSYIWSNSASTKDISSLLSGNYSVTATDSKGCTASETYSVTQPAQLSASISATTPATCFGGATGTVTVAGSGGTPGYTYSWNTSPVQTTATATGLSAGTVYTATITDSKGCTAIVLATVTQPTAVSVNGFIGEVSCYGGSNGSISLSVTGGNSPYSFDWGDGVTSQNRTGLMAGTYTVIVTDANNCTSPKSFTITQPTVLTASCVATNSSCYSANDGSINLTVNGGSSPFTYAWSNSASSEDLTGLAPGTYSVTVTDALGCTATSSATITQPDLLTVTGVVRDNCSGSNNGSIVLTVTGGTSGYTYLWSNGATTKDVTGLGSGPNSVVVTDVNGCSATASFTLASMTASLTTFPVTCVYYGDPFRYGIIGDGQIYPVITNGTAPFTYAWTGSRNGFTSTAAFLSGITWGTYQVTVTDANGCTYTSSATLAAPACNPPVANPDNFTSCGGAVVSGNVATNDTDTDYPSGPFEVIPMGFPGAEQGTITWDSSYNGAFTFTPTPNYSGTVTINYQISDPKNLTATGVLTIYVSALTAQVTSANTSHVQCGASNGSATVTTSGGIAPFTYLWNDPAGQTTATATGLSAGTYSVTVTDAKLCSVTTQVTIQNVCMTFTKTLHAINGNTSATTFNAVGDILSYDLTLTNTGSTPLTNILVTDPLTGQNQNVASLAAAASQTIGSTYTLIASDLTAGTFTNTATANFSYNNVPYSYSASRTVSAGQADLSIAKTVVTSPVVSGAELIYRIVVTNNGPSLARNVQIADNITAFSSPVFSNTLGGTYSTWSSPFTVPVQIGNGTTYTIYIKGTLPVGQCSAVTNGATVSSDNDPNTSNNSSGTITTPVLDQTAPVFSSCPANITVAVNNGCYAMAVNLGTPTATDNCSAVNFSNNAPASFPLGSTVVTWTASDASGNTATCTQTVTVTNAAPNASPDSYSTLEGSAIGGNVLLNDRDPEGQTLTVTNWGTPSWGTLTLTNTKGVFNYNPGTGYTGPATFTYTVQDACGLTSTGTVTITILSCVAPPTITGPIKVTK